MKTQTLIRKSAPAWAALLLATTVGPAAAAPLKNIALTPIGTYASGIYEAAAAEIVAHDPATQRLYVVNAQAAAVDVLCIANPAAPTKVGEISLAPYGGVANSVAVRDGILAVAVEAFIKTDPGLVIFFGAALTPLSSVMVGALPDMITFTPNGRYVLTANEGEPNTYHDAEVDVHGPSVDPEGSVSIINLSGGVAHLTQANVRTADFRDFNGQAAALRAAGIRIFGPNATVAQDLEPEYIAISHDSRTAWVTLQDNNALGVIDIKAGVVTELIPLGTKDHSLTDNGFGSSNGLDPSDRDDEAGTGPAISIVNRPVKGVYQSDAVAAYKAGAQTFLVMANEGDAREYPGFNEVLRVGAEAYALDATAFPNAAELKAVSNLGRLQATIASGDLDGDGDYDEIHSFGGRSFTIRKPTGEVVFDSGDQFEQITASLHEAGLVVFNASHGNNTLDSRSSVKGPEPEGLAIGRAFGRQWAFIGLERIGGVMVYDVTNPYQARFVTYVNNRDFTEPTFLGTPPDQVSNPAAGDLGPEGLLFIKAEDSPNGKPLLVLGNEISGTTTIFEIARAK